MASSTVASLSMTAIFAPVRAETLVLRGAAGVAVAVALTAEGDRRRHGKAGAVADARAQNDRMPERLGHALHDGQAEAEAADGRAVRGRAALELLEDDLPLGFADAGAGVPHLDAHVRPAPARAQPDAAALGILHRIDHQVLQDAAQHQRIGNDGQARCGATSSTAPWRAPAARCRARCEAKRSSSGTGRSAGVEHARLELGEIEDGLQQLLDRRQRVVDALGDAALMLVAVRLGKRAGERRAACSGCSRSWPTAVKKRVLKRLARSEASRALDSSSLVRSRRDSALFSSSVRMRTWPSSLIAVWNSE